MRDADFFRFIQEREAIRIRKEEARLPYPWTEDPILRDYKFTNVKRYNDRTSRELIKGFYFPNRNAPRTQVLLNCAIARYFGTSEFALALGWQTAFVPGRIKELATERMKAGERVFTGAYIITNNGMKGRKQDVVVDVFLADFANNLEKIASAAEKFNSWAHTVDTMRQVRGFGGSGFMAKETILDTFYTRFWKEAPLDLNTWTPVGPGSMRGAARVLGDDTAKPLSEAETLKLCRDLFAKVPDYWPPTWSVLELHDIQFQLCEFDKYERVRLGQGRPRSVYRGPK